MALALALPALVLVLVEWVFWGLRDGQAGFGVNIDGLALLAALAVALATAGSARSPETPAMGSSAILQRLATASFGLLAASACLAVFAYVRLSSITIGPVLRSELMGLRFLWVMFALVAAPPIVWLVRLATLRVPHGVRLAVALASIAFACAIAVRPTSAGPRLEYLSVGFRTAASLPTMMLEVEIADVTIKGVRFEYLAVGNKCVMRAAHPFTGAGRAISPSSFTSGFATCPGIDFYDAPDFAYATLSGAGPDAQSLFTISGGSLGDEIQGARPPAPAREKIASLPSIRARYGSTADREASDGITVARDGASFERCRITVRDGERTITSDLGAVHGSGRTLEICKPVRVTRSRELGVVNVDIPDVDMSTGTPEPSSVSTLDGVRSSSVSLADVARRVALPKSWRAFGLAGIAFAEVALFFAIVSFIRARRLRGFTPAHHQGGGKLSIGDGEIVEAEAARMLDVGEVLVRGPMPVPRAP
ncbi:MAG: hypothetical protein JNK04_21760, partial [Myxococcales bacterium]|nr:hypothetical protein [Myxococcales bacterium]